MKKIAVGVLIALVVLVVVGALAVHLFLDGAIKRGVEAFGPRLTQVPIKLDSVSLSLLSGSGSVKGLVVGNPQGYKAPSAIAVGLASLALQPSSLLSDKVIVHSINVEAPEITFETDLHGNNLSRILANIDSAMGQGNEPAPSNSKEAKPGRKLEVDEFNITRGKIHVSVTVLGGRAVTVPLPDISLKDLGKDANGITPAELTRQVMKVVLVKATEAGTAAVADLTKQATGLTTDGVKSATGAGEKLIKGFGDVFKKKQ